MIMMVTFGDAHDGNGDDVHVGDENLPSSDCSTEPRPESGLSANDVTMSIRINNALLVKTVNGV